MFSPEIRFPALEKVFVEPSDKYGKLLKPLFSMELSLVNPEWDGLIHMVSPVEPMEDSLGGLTGDFHSYYCRNDWVGFKIEDDNRYRLLGDLRFFALEAGFQAWKGPFDEYTESDYEELVEFYETQEEEFADYKEEYGDMERCFVIEAIGEMPHGYGNWVTQSFPGMKYDHTSDSLTSTPVSEAGNSFHLICESRDVIGNRLILFYEPIDKLVLITKEY